MEIQVVVGDPARVKADAILLGHFEGEDRPGEETAGIDEVLGGAIRELIGQGEVKGKLNELTLLHSLGRLEASRIVLLGLGKQSEHTEDRISGAVGEACRLLRQKGCKSIITSALGSGIAGVTAEAAAQAVTEGALLGLYSFRRHFTTEADYGEVSEIKILAPREERLAEMERGSMKGRIVAEAAIMARDMANEPANYMTPAIMAETAERLAGAYGLGFKALEEKQMEEMGMGALLGVARGSREPAKFIVLEYRGKGSGNFDIALVGKGITFDSGGISIKPSEKMGEMKGDMSGGGAVIAVMGAIARLKPAINVITAVPATENLPDGNAIKPGDVLTAMGGKTIEIISTDAEGRLALADALGYVNKAGARRIVDVATLTGACHIALGDVCSGAFGNDKELIDRVIAAGSDAGELIWPMPMYSQYREQNKSDVADIKNAGGRYGGAITAAQFLAEFVGETPWVHIDIAGTFLSDKDKGYLTKGATGVPVRTLANLVLRLSE
ncbi:MAG: leucyl aminopeptidase [Dehalococcoidales bacterium]